MKCWKCGKEVKEPFTICDDCAKKEYEKHNKR
jgi:NMD protein affecting ribosome stability and mRNA decay